MNWQSILSDLTDWGLTQVQIAKKCRCTQSRISELARKTDTTVGYQLGANLVALHKAEARKRPRVADKTAQA